MKTQYLIVLRHQMDDLPLQLCDDRNTAFAIAKRMNPDAGENVKDLLQIDCTTPVCVWVYKFVNGRPKAAWLVKSFDDQESPNV